MELLALAFVHPGTAVRLAAEERWTGLTVLVAAVILGGVAAVAAGSGGRWGGGGLYPAGLFVVWTAASVFVALLWAAVLHLTATLLGGSGSLEAFLPALGLSYAPNLLVGLVPLLASRGLVPGALLVGMLIAAGHLWLAGVAVQRSYRLSAARTLLAVAAPPAAGVLLLLLALLPAAGWVTGVLAAG